MSVWPRQVNRGLRLSQEMEQEDEDRGRRLSGMWTLAVTCLAPLHFCVVKCSREKISPKKISPDNKSVFVETCVSVRDRIRLSQYLETERGRKECPPLDELCIFFFTIFCLLLPHLHRKGQDCAHCAPGTNPSVHRSAPHMGSAHTSAQWCNKSESE